MNNLFNEDHPPTLPRIHYLDHAFAQIQDIALKNLENIRVEHEKEKWTLSKGANSPACPINITLSYGFSLNHEDEE